MRRIYLVRHGKADTGTDSRKCLGRINVPMHSSAIRPSIELGKWIRAEQEEKEASLIVASGTLDRAKDTAGFIIEGAGDVVATELIQEPDFNEIFTGIWEGLEFSKIKEKFSKEYEERGKSLGYFSFPEGESLYDATIRFENALNFLRAMTNKDILVVSHSGVIRGMLCRLLGVTLDDFMMFGASNLNVTILSDDGILRIEKVGYKPTILFDEKEWNNLMIKYKVLDQVVRHMCKTAEFAGSILDEIDPQGTRFDRELIVKAAMVHDIIRNEPMHERKGADILRREGFYDIAEIVEKHHSTDVDESEELNEEEILFYADKRIQQEEVVSIDKRFEVSAGKCHTAEARRKHKELYRKSEIIEKKIYGGEL